MLGYLGQNLLSKEALSWPLDTIRDCMSDMKKPNLPSLLTTLNVPGNSRCKETRCLGTELGRWPSTLLLYGQIPTNSWCIVDDKVTDIATGHHTLATYWAEETKGHYTSHQNLLEFYSQGRNNKRDELGFCNSPAPDVPNCPFGPSLSEHSSAATTLILSR